MNINVTPALVATGISIALGIGAMVNWMDDISAHLFVEPRVAALEERQTCQSCIDLCMQNGDMNREECYDECFNYGLCPSRKRLEPHG